MSDLSDLQRIFHDEALGLRPVLSFTKEDPPKVLLGLFGLEVTFVFDEKGQLLGAVNWKEGEGSE